MHLSTEELLLVHGQNTERCNRCLRPVAEGTNRKLIKILETFFPFNTNRKTVHMFYHFFKKITEPMAPSFFIVRQESKLLIGIPLAEWIRCSISFHSN